MVQIGFPKPHRTSNKLRFKSPRPEPAPKAVVKLTRAYHSAPKPWWLKWLWVGVPSFVLCLALVALYTPFLKIKNVIINNAPGPQAEERIRELVAPELARHPWYVFPKNHIWLVSSYRIINALAQEFYTEGIVIERRLPNVLKITFPSSAVVARYKSGESEWLMDKRGVLVQIYQSGSTNPPMYQIVDVAAQSHSIGEQVIEDAALSRLLPIFTALENEFAPGSFSHIQYDTKALPTIQLYSVNGWYALLSLEGSAAEQANNLKRILVEKIKGNEAKLEYVDVRFGSKVFLQMR